MIRSRRNTKPPSARKSELPVGGGLLTRGALPTPPSQPGGKWHVGAGASPLTAAGPFRIRTGFPDRSPVVAPRLPSSADGPVARPLPLGARRPLGRCDLHAVVDPEPGYGSRHLGLRAPQGRAHDGVRGAGCPLAARTRTGGARFSRRPCLRRIR